ncbi:MAG: tyrosine-type recombinase/integrase [Bacteroidota bacterium]
MNISAFISYLQFEKRVSANTVVSYESDLIQFNDFLALNYQIDDVKEINHLIIRSWIIELMEHQISPRSVNRKISSLKSFFKFLMREQQIEKNPMTKVVSPKTSKRLPEFVDKEGMDVLFDEKFFEKDYEGIRDQLILEIFYATGMRLSELVNIKISDIDFSRSLVKVLGKRNKTRLIPFSNRLQKLINCYLEERKKITVDNETDILFLTIKGKKIYQKLVYRIVNLYLRGITTIDKKSPHVLRHTFATHMLNNGADLNAIKELLGHVNLSATQVYTHNTIEKLTKVYKQAHPKA